MFREEPIQKLGTREGSSDTPIGEQFDQLPIKGEIMANVANQLEGSTTSEEFTQMISNERIHLANSDLALRELFYELISIDENDVTHDELVNIN